MSPWKKIASLFIIAAPLGLFVPACVGGVEEPTNDVDFAESEAATTDAVPGEDTNMTRADEYDYPPPGPGCWRWCEERYRRCLPHDDPRAPCGWARYTCRRYCRNPR